jgi:hypothetical protein
MQTACQLIFQCIQGRTAGDGKKNQALCLASAQIWFAACTRLAPKRRRQAKIQAIAAAFHPAVRQNGACMLLSPLGSCIE